MTGDQDTRQGQEEAQQDIDPVLQQFPDLGPQIQIAREYLYRVIKGEIKDPSKDRNPLLMSEEPADSEAMARLRIPLFDGKTALMVLREQVEKQLREEQRQAQKSARQTAAPEDENVRRQPYDRLKYPDPRSKKLRKQTGNKGTHLPKPLVHGKDSARQEYGFGHVPVRRYAAADIPIISSDTDIASYSPNASSVYLSSQVVNDSDRVRRILERFPHLVTIQVSPMTRIKSEIKALLAGKDIKREGIRNKRRLSEVPMINRVEGIDEYPVDSTTVIHLSNQDVLGYQVVQAIIDRYKNLKVLELYPTAQLSTELQKLADLHGIHIQQRRRREMGSYDITPISQEYQDDKERYLAAFTNSATQEMVEFMRRQEFIEITIADSYYGDERVSLRKVSRELNILPNRAQRRLQILNAALGGNTNSEHVRRKAESLKKRIRYLQTLETDAAQRERYRTSMSVTVDGVEIAPPPDLPMGRWEMWQKIASTSNEGLERLRAQSERQYNVLMAYWQPRTQGPRKNTIQLAKDYQVTYQAISLALQKALKRLGVEEE